MPRPNRADEAGGLYHALNRGSARAEIFRKPEDYDAFERILADGLQRYPCQILAYQLMPNHWHLVLRPTEDGGMSNFLRWVSLTHTIRLQAMRLHADDLASRKGHVYQGRFKSFPIQADDHFLVVCRYVERNAQRAGLVERAEDWKWGSLARWLAKPEPAPKLLTPWPVRRPPNWAARVNQPLTDQELAAVRLSVKRGRPLGDARWTEALAQRLGLESTLRPQGRPRKA